MFVGSGDMGTVTKRTVLQHWSAKHLPVHQWTVGRGVAQRNQDIRNLRVGNSFPKLLSSTVFAKRERARFLVCRFHSITEEDSTFMRPCCHSQRRRGLRSGSAAARLMGLRVWIPPGARMSVCLSVVVCCQVDVSASDWTLVRRSSTECGVSDCNREALAVRRPRAGGGCCVVEKKWGRVHG
jgi:hypothetical protein